VNAVISIEAVGKPESSIGYVGRIPIRNLWLLMLYASDLFQCRGSARVGIEDSPDDLPDLVAEILARAVEIRLRRQLSYGYTTRSGIISRVRGRIDVLATERHQWLARGRIVCQYADLTIDTPTNQFVRGALESISRLVQRKDIRGRCRSLANGLKDRGVSGDAPSCKELERRIGRPSPGDEHMLSAARLAYDLCIPTESAGARPHFMPNRDERWARKLFERAVGGFYDVVLSPKGVSGYRGTQLQWQVQEKTSQIDAILPRMYADIILEKSSHRLVIDTKFNEIVTPGWRRESTLRSAYLFQIYAYIHSQVGRGSPLADNAAGMLLHPSLGVNVDESVIVQGHELRFATVDLTGSNEKIRYDLLRLVEGFVSQA